jgi:hypothetical protein
MFSPMVVYQVPNFSILSFIVEPFGPTCPVSVVAPYSTARSSAAYASN